MTEKAKGRMLLIAALTVMLLFVFALAVQDAYADDSGTSGACTWQYVSASKTLTVSGNGAMADYPDAASVPWFSYRNEIQKVVIREGVTEIGDFAFDGLSMTSITTPSTTTRIGQYAFAFCHKVSEGITVNGTDCVIENDAFSESSTEANTFIKLNGVKSVGDSAFYDVYSETLDLGNVVTLEDAAFALNDLVEEVVIPKTCTSVGYCAFSSCTHLERIIFLNKNTTIDSDEHTIYPDGTPQAEIWGMAGSTAETYANDHNRPFVLGGLTGDCEWIIENIGGSMTLTIKGPGKTEDDYDISSEQTRAPWYSARDMIQAIVVEDGVTSLGNQAFRKCSSLKAVTLPSGLTELGERAFNECSELEQIIIPEGIIKIKYGTFMDCINLKDVTLPESVVIIGGMAFDHCKELYSIRIPGPLENIEGAAFAGCPLTSIYGHPGYYAKTYAKASNRKFYCSIPHALDEGTTIQEASCLQEGRKEFSCTQCDYKTLEFYPLGGHSWVEVIVKRATLTADGEMEKTCTTCGAVEEKKTIYHPQTFKLAYTKTTYDGKEKTPAITITDANGQKIAATNYIVSYSDNQNAGTAKVKVTFKGNYYSETKALSFTIERKKITIPKAKAGLNYNNTKQTGVAAGTGFTVTGGVQIKAGTYTAKAILKDTKNTCWADGQTVVKAIKWTIAKVPLSKATIGAIKAQEFTGSVIKPALTVKTTLNKKAVSLAAGTDYTAKYTNNIYAGTATVTLTGKGNYTGTRTVTFKINRAKAEAERLSGDNRYATSQAIADAYKRALGVKQFDAVCVADGTNYPDALAGSGFASLKKAPIISINKAAPTGRDTLGALSYIRRNLKPKGMVYILGGPGSVPETVEQTLKSYGFTVKRIWGQNRYLSNIAILQEAKVKAGSEFIVCTGADFADALSASAAGKPVLLVGGTKLTAEQNAYLKSVSPSKFWVIGDSTVVDSGIEKELKTHAPVTRITGKTTYQRSVAIAKKFFPGLQIHINIADGKNFPDALCGGPMAVLAKGPLILVDDRTEVIDPILSYVKAARTFKVTVFGGTGSVGEPLVNKILSVN